MKHWTTNSIYLRFVDLLEVKFTQKLGQIMATNTYRLLHNFNTYSQC